MGGVARRAWARNPNAMSVVSEFNRSHAGEYHITEPYLADENLLAEVLSKSH